MEGDGSVNKQIEPFKEYCILELFGHRKLAGMVSEQSIGGTSFIRIDIPQKGQVAVTQFYSPAAVYCMTPTTEAIARAYAAGNVPDPVQRWELKLPEPEVQPLMCACNHIKSAHRLYRDECLVTECACGKFVEFNPHQYTPGSNKCQCGHFYISHEGKGGNCEQCQCQHYEKVPF